MANGVDVGPALTCRLNVPVDISATPKERKASMKGKRQTTMAKRARERLVQERRALKREKKQAAAEAAREAESLRDGPSVETTD